ncbi:putative Transcriptional regulator, LysR family [Vibrio nigripulchritudo SO65]|uniref:LysR family transcriptional regulator n=1 Tax=Vibrio nigripulchritudo TaxID=28173 RepID=UPI0003B1E20C|nr:LysR family transcriptional regulator [Vibrio nigripulchritudo]CCN37649.1 putative Transcriptional regulator, LysR family [Vibrio nigripulchritudo AM115]CCN40790.1 putative Transcriptional regulator, LysR family [Vibrio nigripulchritudo FTn2]CCN64401.1 putative Transcriptional regulator, LysR family [Vibrio nigripulchritudo POn4]CCN77490.1 putative Transcriptional regulator, LysR family [Vibrio nigripulchritudo SO65]
MIDQVEQQWLRTFHCVYENNGFKQAANTLNLPTSNVSRHIALLEDKLNTKLFERTTRRIAPTHAGDQLYAATLPLLEKLDDALKNVSRHSHEVIGQLKILMPDSSELAKSVIAFCKKYPSIELCCDTSLSPKEDLFDGFDLILSFHRGALPDNNWVAKEIKRWESVVVASPNRIKESSRPYKITDLNHVPCISSLTAAGGTPWIFKKPDGELVTQNVKSSFKVNSGNLAKSGALAGFGFAILPADSCREDVESGLLEIVTLEYQPDDLVLYAYHASRKHLPKKVSMFVEHLQSEASSTDAKAE